MTKERPVTDFRSNTKAGVDVSSNRFYKRNNVSTSKANFTATCTVFVLCHLLITELYVTKYRIIILPDVFF
jgi:hypothetical protein